MNEFLKCRIEDYGINYANTNSLEGRVVIQEGAFRLIEVLEKRPEVREAYKDIFYEASFSYNR